jgi:hypothetical protein
MNEREKLIKKLGEHPIWLVKDRAEEVADFIISERKRIIDKIMNLYFSDEWKGLETLRKLKEQTE